MKKGKIENFRFSDRSNSHVTLVSVTITITWSVGCFKRGNQLAEIDRSPPGGSPGWAGGEESEPLFLKVAVTFAAQAVHEKALVKAAIRKNPCRGDPSGGCIGGKIDRRDAAVLVGDPETRHPTRGGRKRMVENDSLKKPTSSVDGVLDAGWRERVLVTVRMGGKGKGKNENQDEGGAHRFEECSLVEGAKKMVTSYFRRFYQRFFFFNALFYL